MTETNFNVDPPGEKYLALIRAHPLRPIKGDDDLDHASEVLDSLVARDDLAPEEDDYLRVLEDLIESYEDEHFPVSPDEDAEDIEATRKALQEPGSIPWEEARKKLNF